MLLTFARLVIVIIVIVYKEIILKVGGVLVIKFFKFLVVETFRNGCCYVLKTKPYSLNQVPIAFFSPKCGYRHQKTIIRSALRLQESIDISSQDVLKWENHLYYLTTKLKDRL